MSYRERLPQLDGGLFLTDGGIETTLIFHQGIELPAFAAFVLLDDEKGTEELRRYYEPYLELAADRGSGFVLETPTWRASPKWATKLGYSDEQLDALNRKAIALMEDLRHAYADRVEQIVISGCIGPQADAYAPEEVLDAEASRDYHSTQIHTFADTAADMVTAITMTYVDEAVGITEAAKAAAMPVAISFTLETDGRLPSGQPLDEAITELDDRTGEGADYVMLNCAHPTHFDDVLEEGASWVDRIAGLRANASTRSHAELDEAPDLDAGDPADLAERYAALGQKLPRLNVLGGCCGTDARHITEIAVAWPASMR